MSSDLRHYPSIFNLFYLALFLPCVITGPIPISETFYGKSIESLVANKCKMPEEIDLPFNSTSDPTNFSFLSAPLKECQIVEPLKENEEAHLLCKEIFEVLKNITCSDYNTSLPKIVSTRVSKSKEVCSEFKDMEDVLPKQNEYLSGKLVDGMICKLLCLGKFESLCRTLLWSYDVQVQIENASKLMVGDEENGDNNIGPNKDTANTETNVSNAKQEPVLDDVNNERTEQAFVDPNMPIEDETKKNPAKELEPMKNLEPVKNLEPMSPTSKSSIVSPTLSSKLDTKVTNNQNPGSLSETTKTIVPGLNENLDSVGKVTAEDKQNIQQDKLNIDVQDNGQLDLNNKDGNPDENEVNDETQQKYNKPINLPKVEVTDQMSKSSTSGTTGKKSNKSKEISSGTMFDTRKSKTNTTTTNIVETNINVEKTIPASVPEGNELNTDFQGEENESKGTGKPSDTQIPSEPVKNKVTEKPKEAESGVPNKVVSNTESTTLQISAGTNAEDDEEQYYNNNDTENNEGDYPKSEYENSLSDLPKPPKTETKSSVVSEVASQNDFPNSYDGFLNTRNNIGRQPDEIQMIPSFPEQEDSHFFFYFLSIVLILMAGYLIFHNKQKIIALIVEGRHERRRRSHGAGYKKLETK